MKRLLSAFELLIAAVDSRTARHPCDQQDTRFYQHPNHGNTSGNMAAV